MSAQSSPMARFLIVMAAFIVVVAGMKAAEAMLVPFFLSLFIAVICSPPLGWMHKKGVPNGVAIVLVIAAVVIVGVLVGAVVGSSIQSFRQDLPEYQARLVELSGGAREFLTGLGISISAQQWKDSVNPSAALAIAGNTLASLGNVMTNAFMILLTVIFILAEEVGFTEKLRSAAGDEKQKSLEAIARFTHSVNRYMAIKTSLSLLTGVTIIGWLWVQGVDYAVLWGLLAFFLNFVPTLGSILAAIPAVLLALVQLGVGDAVLTAVGFLLVNVVVGNALEPRLMGKGLDLSALVVFLSLVFWGWVLGPVGMLLSVPLTMTVKIALESFEDTQWLGVMLGSGRSVAEVRMNFEEVALKLAKKGDDSAAS